MILIDNKLSEGLARLLSLKEVQHFEKSGTFVFSEDDRENYFRHFEHAQVAEIAEYGIPRKRRQHAA